jgi:very-short-patch-repair endonuclease
MADSEDKHEITKQQIYDLRRRLLDTSKNNPLINFHFSERSRTHVRVVNVLPDSLYTKLKEKVLTFASLPQVQQVPPDEQTDAFRMALQTARLSDEDYLFKTKALDAEKNPNATGEQQLEQELRNKVRRQLGLPPHLKKELPSAVECAKQMGINPSFELPFPDEKSNDTGEDSERAIQTLLFPEQMERKLSGLYNQIRIGLSEMGVNTLYCAWGFLEWFESDDSDIPLFAPLVLLPLQVKQTLVRQTYRYSVESTGENAEMNLTLRERLRQDFAMELPLLEETDTPESYLVKISAMIEDKSRWRVRRFVTIGKLSFSRLVMYQDLDPSRWPANRPLQEHRVLSDLLGGMERDGATTAEEYMVDDKDVSTMVPILITDADSSQFSAIVDAMKGKNLAIQGPPGTGKSQTITNIIAVALYLGKKVLFISEKMAALEVVKKRLDEAGLGDFCLELHSTKAQKRLSMQHAAPSYYVPIKEEREKLQDQLNEYSKRLCQLWGKTGKTINEIVWIDQRIRDTVAGYKAPEGLGLLVERSADNMTLVNLDERLSKLRIVEEAYYLISRKYGSLGRHPAYGIDGTMMSIFDQESTVLGLSRWLAKISQIAEAASRISRLLETTENSHTLNSVADFLASLRESGCIGQSEIEAGILANLRDQQTVESADRLIADCRIYGSIYDELRSYVHHPEKIIGQEIAQADRLIDLLGKLAINEGIDSLSIPGIKTLSDNLKLTSFKLRGCLLLADEWRQLLGYTGFLTAAGIQNVLSAIQLQVSTPREVIIRRNKELTDEMSAEVLERGRTLARHINTTQTELEQRFIINLGETPQRLRQLAYIIREAGLLGRLSSSYKNAVKAYVLMLRPKVQRPKPAQMASDFLAIADLLEEIRRLNDDPQIRRVVGLDYRGAATGFALMLSVNEYGRRVRSSFTINTELGKRIRQFLLEDPSEVLDAVQAVAKGIDIDDMKNYVDVQASRDPNKDINGVCREHDEAAAEADALHANLSALTVKEHVSIREMPNLARTINELERASLNISENSVAIQALGSRFNGPSSGTESVCSAIGRAKSILSAKLPSSCISSLLSDEHNVICLELSSIAKELDKLLSQETDIRSIVVGSKRVDFSLFLGNESVGDVAIASILERLHLSVDNPSAFSEWAKYCQVRQEAIDLGLGQMVDSYLPPEALPPPSLHVAEAYEWVFYRSLVRSFFAAFPQFAQFSGLNHESVRQRYAKLDRDTILLQRSFLAQRLSGNPITRGVGTGLRSGWTNRYLVEKEIGRRRGHIPLRDLLMRASDAILAMKPCFMMSPASVAQFIRPESDAEFDIVIIDEASQMKPEEALGAIARGKQLIVVGDPKQLPPTSFFDRTDFPDDGEETNPEDYIDTESILDLSLSTFGPSRNLNWHYRSRHESLIAFSNKSFYDGSPLTVFPSSKSKHRDLGIEYRFVNGVYRGRTNIVEAQEVIAIAKEHMYRYPDRSLGIVTMNIPQMEILNAELELLFSHDRRCHEYRVRWESTLEPVFAKNLENVQGDERDVIFISTLYGPNETGGKVPQRFGPVNSSAGSRRLNVLFTRAKEKIVVVSSMKSTDIIPTATSQEGVAVLKAYLEYARTGKLEQGRASGREPDSDFEICVGERLRQYGYEVVPQIGVSGYYVDLGVKDPNNLDSYVLGIECDGRTYHSAKSARDRDRLRQEVLEAMGWRIHRIWSLDWFQDPEGQMKRLLDHLKGLCEVTPSVASQDRDDAEDVKAEDPQNTQMQEPQITSVGSALQFDDDDTSEDPTPTPDSDQVLNTPISPQRPEVSTFPQPTELVEEGRLMEFVLKKERETPGTWRYKENKDERPLTVYLTKEQVKELGDPQSIKVTIAAA